MIILRPVKMALVRVHILSTRVFGVLRASRACWWSERLTNRSAGASFRICATFACGSGLAGLKSSCNLQYDDLWVVCGREPEHFVCVTSEWQRRT